MALTIKHVEQADRRIQKKFGKVERAKAEFHFVTTDEVRKAYREIYPDSAAPDGFVDPRSTPYHVWIPYDYKDETLVTHETMHLYGMWYRHIFPEGLGNNVNEGVTEYFTRQVVSERRNSYQAQWAEIVAIVKFMKSEEPLQQAFFRGCFATWMGAVGPKIFGPWLQQMKAAQWEGARKILDKSIAQPNGAGCRPQASAASR